MIPHSARVFQPLDANHSSSHFSLNVGITLVGTGMVLCQAALPLAIEPKLGEL